MIPEGHLPYLFLKNGDMQFLLNMTWMMRPVGGLVKTDHWKSGKDVWDKDIQYDYTKVPLVFLKCCRTLCATLALPSCMRCCIPLWQVGNAKGCCEAEWLVGMKTFQLNYFVLSKFPEEKVFDGWTRLQTVKFYTKQRVGGKDKQERDIGIERYLFTKYLSVNNMEVVENAKNARYVWLWT